MTIQKINPRIGEEVHNVGGSMYVNRILNDFTVEIQHFWARWLKMNCRVVRHNNQLWAF